MLWSKDVQARLTLNISYERANLAFDHGRCCLCAECGASSVPLFIPPELPPFRCPFHSWQAEPFGMDPMQCHKMLLSWMQSCLVKKRSHHDGVSCHYIAFLNGSESMCSKHDCNCFIRWVLILSRKRVGESN